MASSVATPTLVVLDFGADGESDEFITPEIDLEIAFEVICQLDMAEERISLSTGEQSLHKFLKTQVVYLELDMRMHETETHMPVASIASCTHSIRSCPSRLHILGNQGPVQWGECS
jgi:hypothetical protein